MSEVDRCEAVTKRETRCRRMGFPSIPDARGLRYVCRQHWDRPPERWWS